MSESKTLRALDMFRPLFQSLRIDYPVMRQIVEVKLLMDSRRTPTVFAGSKKKENANQFIKSLGIYMLYSLIVLPFIWGDAYMMQIDRKSTRLNSSHVAISYASFCLKKKIKLEH